MPIVSNENSAGKIIYNKDGSASSFEGAAVNVFKASVLASSIRLWAASGIIPTRGVGITKMLKMASSYTGKTYKRKDAEIAAQDLIEWLGNRASITPMEIR